MWLIPSIPLSGQSSQERILDEYEKMGDTMETDLVDDRKILI